jgi:hypothetical protein
MNAQTNSTASSNFQPEVYNIPVLESHIKMVLQLQEGYNLLYLNHDFQCENHDHLDALHDSIRNWIWQAMRTNHKLSKVGLDDNPELIKLRERYADVLNTWHYMYNLRAILNS